MSNFKHLLFASLVAPAIAFAPSAKSQPVEYVKICSAAGPGYFYIPGTATCINALTGSLYDAESGKLIENRYDLAFQGTSIAMAMPTPIIDYGKTFAFSGNFANFEGSQGLALAGAFKAMEGLTFSAGVGVGLNKQTVGTRAGFNFSW